MADLNVYYKYKYNSVYSALLIDTNAYITQNGNSYGVNVNNNGIDLIFSSKNEVLDVWRYAIIDLDLNILGDPKKIVGSSNYFDISPDKIINNYRNIVLILESPHDEEYVKSSFQPIAPANGITSGSTGFDIKKYLTNVLREISQKYGRESPINNKSIYNLIISNPIKYQCSLNNLFIKGCDLQNNNCKNLRNNVWLKLWNINEIRVNFLSRLYNYQPCLIINSCTTGKTSREKDKTNLQRKVTDYILDNTDFLLVETLHPACNWNIHANWKNKHTRPNPLFGIEVIR